MSCEVCDNPVTPRGRKCADTAACDEHRRRRFPKPEPAAGQKDDKAKLKYRLVPWDAMREVVRVLQWGAYHRPRPDGTAGYGEHNWEHVGDARNRYPEAALRHVLAFLHDGESVDPDSGDWRLHHLACATCCLLFALALDLRGRLQEPRAKSAFRGDLPGNPAPEEKETTGR